MTSRERCVAVTSIIGPNIRANVSTVDTTRCFASVIRVKNSSWDLKRSQTLPLSRLASQKDVQLWHVVFWSVSKVALAKVNYQQEVVRKH